MKPFELAPDAVDPGRVPVKTLYTGAKMPGIGLGTFGSDHASPELVAGVVRDALTIGYRYIDCAACYGNEREVGEVLKEAMDAGLPREELFILSKLWNDKHKPEDVIESCKKSIAELQVSYLDCYMVHWPFPNYHAPGCDGDSRNPDSKPFSAGEFLGVWRELEELHDQGLARHLGMSNMTIPKLEAVLPGCRVKPSLIEMELHPSFQQPELFDYCVERGIRVIGFCPLGSPNRPERDRSPEDVADTQLPEVRAVAEARGIHPALVCLKWAIAKGAIPIPFSGSEKNIRLNLACASGDPLTPAEMELLGRAERGCRLVKGQVFLWPGATSWTELWDQNP